MSAVATTINVMRHAFRAGIADYRAIFTWKSWLAGWYVRVLAQVAFFAFIGERLGDDEKTYYLLVGNSLLIAAQVGVFSLNMTSAERWTGTLPLLVASPSSPVVVFSARGAYLAIDGALSALGALFVAGPIFGMDLPWPRVLAVVPLTLIVGLASYGFGTFLAGVVFRFRSINSLVVVTTYVALMAACGVNVPLSYYPEPLELLSRFLPLTNGLLAIRGVFDGSPAGEIVGNAALELVVGLGWMTAALLSFNRLASRGRRDGSLDYGA
ncbi:MAG: ABC transporter permease [Actinomycetota bacterium]|nr:ABC transporter permease [Actinomycetota bacterium]